MTLAIFAGMSKAPKNTSSKNANTGFEEAPQAAFEGAPLSGSVSDWVKQLEAEAEASSVETQREIASKAGKHRKKIEIAAREQHARNRGISSVPTFIVANQHAISGAQPASLWQQVIDELAAAPK